MKTFSFDFNTELPRKLRHTINDKQNLSIKKEAGKKNKIYPAWDRICVIMDRLDDTIRHLNTLELGNNKFETAFDFYEFISCAAVVIDCIRFMGNIFHIDTHLVGKIENTQDVFGNEYGQNGNDRKFFEYIRSLCVTHPTYTSRHIEYQNGNLFHCCPRVVWTHNPNANSGDLVAWVYTSNHNNKGFEIKLYVSHFEKYINKWINHIGDVIDAIQNYNETIYERFRNTIIKTSNEFRSFEEYLIYLQKEYCARYGDNDSYIFDEYVRIFRMIPTNKNNKPLLAKYQNAIVYSIGFLHNALQNMSRKDFENTGIKHPSSNIETELFYELDYISNFNGAFNRFSYNLEKVYYLDPNSNYGYYDKLFARNLIEKIKPIINNYISFNNDESDEETIVLIKLAKYLDALKSKCLLNQNIPNEEKYRENVLSDDEWVELFKEDAEIEQIKEIDIEEILKMYGV